MLKIIYTILLVNILTVAVVTYNAYKKITKK